MRKIKNTVITDKLRLDSLKVVLLSQLLNEAMDSVRGTTLFKGNIKVLSGNLSNTLNPMLRQEVTRVYQENPEMTTNIFRQLDELIDKIANTDINDLVMLNQIHTHYSKNPDDWKNVFDIEFQELNT